MRGVLITLALACVIATTVADRAQTAPATGTLSIGSNAAVYALQQVPDKTIDININTQSGGVRWYRNPVWIAIAVIGGVVVLLLIALVIRGGGGTTIVRG
jgi:hypothetical protein